MILILKKKNDSKKEKKKIVKEKRMSVNSDRVGDTHLPARWAPTSEQVFFVPLMIICT